MSSFLANAPAARTSRRPGPGLLLPPLTSSRSLLWLLVALGILAPAITVTALSLGASAQESLVFRTTSELVVVQAVVFSSDRGPVTDLTVDDFKITERGEERPISVFIGPDSGPLEVALLVDSSGSMVNWPTQQATQAILDSLDPGSCVLLMPFADELKSAVWGRPGDASIRDAVAGLKLWGHEVIYDAFLAAFDLMRSRAATQSGSNPPAEAARQEFSVAELTRFRSPGRIATRDAVVTEGSCTPWRQPFAPPDSRPSGRRAVALVTDGVDTASQATLEDVMLAAWGSRVPVFVFVMTRLPRPYDNGNRSRTPAWLAHFRRFQQLAEYSGGIVMRANVAAGDDSGFLEGFKSLGAALRSHYVLGYVPAGSSDAAAVVDRRRIKVSVRRSGLDVLAPSDLVMGRGASEGAAFDLALRGFQQLAITPTTIALGTFDAAAALGPKLGLAHFGRGLSLVRLERSQDALAAFHTAEHYAPWIPDLDARIAELLVETGDADGAWDRVVRAYRDGAAVTDLINRLQELAPRRVDLTRLPVGRRVTMRATNKAGPLGDFMKGGLVAALGRGILGSQHLTLATTPTPAPVNLHVEITAAKPRGTRVELEGLLLLENPDGRTLENPDGKKLLVRKFRLSDAESPEEIAATAAAVVAEIERLLAIG